MVLFLSLYHEYATEMGFVLLLFSFYIVSVDGKTFNLSLLLLFEEILAFMLKYHKYGSRYVQALSELDYEYANLILQPDYLSKLSPGPILLVAKCF